MTQPHTIATYLAAVEGRLPGPRSRRRDVLDELRDGLEEAVGGADGVRPGEADGGGPGEGATALPSPSQVRSAIRAFGDPTQVGDALATEMRLRLVRRRSVQMLAVLATIHLGWLAFRSAVGFPTALLPSAPTDSVFLAAVRAIRAVGWVAVIATAGLVLATSTRRRGGHSVGVAVVGAAVGASGLGLAFGITALVTIDAPSAPMLGVGIASLVALLLVAVTGVRVLDHLTATRPAR